ncbi:hypothetical protein CFIMG_008338RA00001 [Ceratocystis fimbriata CBS 114723]|uniref:Infection structure specific protein n=1 Tax=Ceratocystis fimbriata CBS 114723 TaxID=1035309 RepID=A0A2C5WZ53_9PEZI|nr:hypothetical protein CFIMG_008338RA00001 [Ceratocystis fimbriata CBS 114723]
MLSNPLILAAISGLVPATLAIHNADFDILAGQVVRNQIAPTPHARVEDRDTKLSDILAMAMWIPSSCHDELSFITEAPAAEGALGAYEDSGVDPCLTKIPTSLSRDYASYSSKVLSWIFAHNEDVMSLYSCLGTMTDQIESTTYCDAVVLTTAEAIASEDSQATGTQGGSTNSGSAAATATSSGASATSSTESAAGRVFSGLHALAVAGIFAVAIAL